MVSTVRSRPNHYETLGLTPTASNEDILRAFAREMSMFRARPMAAVAQISVAYETLRNPAKRRAYDASLGLGAEPEAADPPAPRTAFIVAAPRARAEGLPERRLGSFIAESLRDPERADEPSPEPDLKPEPEVAAKPGVEAHLADLLAARHGGEGLREARPAQWKRPAMAGGALVLAVGLAGALLGWRGGEAPPPAEPDMAIALPEATPPQDIAAVSPDPAPAQVEAPPERSVSAPVVAPPVERTPSSPQLAGLEELQAELGPAAESRTEETATEQAAAESPAAQSVAAALPLPNATIARTIGRIGYACGQVASTEPVAGEAAGVFKVTCTSGQSYRAAPVRGRYHFRRWDRQ